MKYLKDKVVAVLVIKTLEGLEAKIESLVFKGYSVLEVTLRTDFAFDAIQLIKKKFPELKVGAGTVLTIEQMNHCIEINADFGVAPGFNKEIVEAAKNSHFDFIPGIATPSDIELAMSMGIELVKVFPAKVLGGIDFIKAISGPYHTMRFMPTGGIGEADYKTYLTLPNVLCVGGTWMDK
jgi:2-dehydro-3-deoxyphosphogluconate aldolase/(4S)-4-hydroxy-2-oxoglutarate aldolase